MPRIIISIGMIPGSFWQLRHPSYLGAYFKQDACNLTGYKQKADFPTFPGGLPPGV
ncbi:hypothetical protein DCCM_0246 [Desulfocucumis palustris]|uniref:Uncharacterized protein n=1 Tax=Desulfocucumis palustris TaxID=1898651 RepID=A0A2L2X7B4_9FIRM|nr:hypothetical protein DCCM_0246 [Desulfocucumis palustris]